MTTRYPDRKKLARLVGEKLSAEENRRVVEQLLATSRDLPKDDARQGGPFYDYDALFHRGTIPSALWQETQRAAAAWEKARDSRGTDLAGPEPGPVGRVVIFPELGEPQLAWAVLHRESGDSPRLLLIAADVNPLVAAGDVAVAGPGTGALTLRCRFSVRASENELGPAILLGTLPAEALAQAEVRWQDIAAGRPVGTFTEQETEDDPEYQDWINDVVRPAAGTLEQRFGAAVPNPSPALPFYALIAAGKPLEKDSNPFAALPFPTPSPASSRLRGAWMRWAAVLAFAALGAGSGWLLWREGQEIDGFPAATAAGEAAYRQAIAEMEAHQADLEARYRAQLEALEAQLVKLRQAPEIRNPLLIDGLAAGEAAYRQAIAELEARLADLEDRYRAQLRDADRDRERLVAEHRVQLEALEAQLAKLRQAPEIRNPVPIDGSAASEAAYRQTIAELEARLADLENRLRDAGQDRERLVVEHRERLYALEAQVGKLRRGPEIRNPVFASLDSSAAVRGTTKLAVGPEVSHLLLYLPVDDPAGTQFEVEVSKWSSNRSILLQKGLRSDTRGKVLLGVPAALTPPGDYRVRLVRVTAGGEQLVREHLIEVEEDPKSRQ